MSTFELLSSKETNDLILSSMYTSEKEHLQALLGSYFKEELSDPRLGGFIKEISHDKDTLYIARLKAKNTISGYLESGNFEKLGKIIQNSWELLGIYPVAVECVSMPEFYQVCKMFDDLDWLPRDLIKVPGAYSVSFCPIEISYKL